MVPALYEIDSNSFLPTTYTRGPWRDDAQHGGPPAGLLGRAIQAELPEGFSVARITALLSKSVPFSLLTTTASLTQLSRRTARIDATLSTESGPVATASALAMLEERGLTPSWTPSEASALAPKTAEIVAPNWRSDPEHRAFHRDSLELRIVHGSFGEPGPATVWARMRYPLVRGEITSPLCRVLCVADLGAGVSSVYESDAAAGMINSDLSFAVTRPLMGEWVKLDSVTRVATRGLGLCVSSISDEFGHVGEVTQSLLSVAAQ